jgi:hypothetical protein
LKKTLVLSLVILIGNIGQIAQAHTLSAKEVKVLKHNKKISEHTVSWYQNKGHWTLHTRFKTCSDVVKRYSVLRGGICYQARLNLRIHRARIARIETVLHPIPRYSDGGYNWNSLVYNCEAKGSGWYADTGNGFYFGPQFTSGTWHSSGGGPVREMDGYGPPMSSYSIPYIEHIAYNTLRLQGSGAWPNCNSYL